MPQILKNAGLAYLPIPKVGCTSIKQMLYEAEHGRRFAPYPNKNGKMVYVHDLYPAIPFDELDHDELSGLFRFAVVRDPVKRVLSAYGNRVVAHGELSAEKAGSRLAEAGLSPDPDLGMFIDRIDDYAAAAMSIWHHLRPQVEFLGTDPSYLSRLYKFSELDVLAEDVRQKTGTAVSLPWLQKGGPKFSAEDISRHHVEKIRERYAQDYSVFGAWF